MGLFATGAATAAATSGRNGHEWPRWRPTTMAAHPTDTILGDAPAIAELREQIQRLASFDRPGSAHIPTVLIQGETGPGRRSDG